MRLGLVTKEFKNNHIDFNKNQIIKTAIDYKNQNIDFLCFGEAFLQGFDAFTWDLKHDHKAAINRSYNMIAELKLIAKMNKIGLAFGYLEKEGLTFFSSYIFIDKNGKEIYNYRRYSSGWKEIGADERIYQEGKDIGIFNYKDKKIAVGLCGDFWDKRYQYYEKVSMVTKDIVIWPVYVNYSLSDWENEIQEYAKQSLLFGETVVMINSISKNPTSHGGCFVFNNGKLIQKIPFDVENVLIFNI